MSNFQKTMLSLICAFVLVGAGGAWADEPKSGKDDKLVFTDAAQGGYSMPYHLLLPGNYDAKGRALPVILFLHGAGERGTNNTSQMSYIKYLISETQGAVAGHEAIVIVPQCPNGEVWNGATAHDDWKLGAYTNAKQQKVTKALQAAMDILAHVEATTNADKRRVYVTGLSMGGYGTWDAITQFPKVFAAAMPLSGGGNTEAAGKLAKVPVWAFHGTSDGVVPTSGSGDMIKAITAAGGHPIYSLITGGGHGGWDEFYQPHHWTVDHPSDTKGKGADLYTWLFAQALAP